MKNIKKVICVIAAVIILTASMSMFAFAEETTAASAASGDNAGFAKGMGLLAAAIVTSLAGIGGGIAIAAGAPAAIAANAENPKTFGKSIIFVALGESIILFGFVVSILILQKV